MNRSKALDKTGTLAIHVQPSRGVSLRLFELWSYRELLYFFIWRDLKVRYKQTVLGAAWAVLQPLATMAVFSFFFGKLAGISSGGVPYPLFAFAALVPWTFFANGVMFSTISLVANRSLITKVYFPRLALPIAVVLSGLVDFAVSFLVLLGMTFAYGLIPGPQLLLVLPLMLIVVAACLGTGLWLSALNVSYRDVGYVVPFLIQLWLFATPVAYPSSLLEDRWRTIYAINPMVSVVEGFRDALLGSSAAGIGSIFVSAASALILLTTGALYFRRVEQSFADVI